MMQYATPNKSAYNLMPELYQNNEILFPPAKEVKKLPFPLYLGEEYNTLVNKSWTRVLAS